MDPIWYLYFSIAFLVLGMLVFLAIFSRIRDNRYRMFVDAHSIALHEIRDIKSKYRFYPSIDFSMCHSYDNENMYLDIRCEDYLIYELQFPDKAKAVRDQMNRIQTNRILFKKYQDAITSMTSMHTYDAPLEKLNPGKVYALEDEITKNLLRDTPQVDFYIDVDLYLTNINGYMRDHHYKRFSENEISEDLDRLSKKYGNRFLDEGIWKSIVAVERGKVSNRMRFSIYQRDGYRCCRCGRSGDETMLEVDHIVPIAKGGKSTYDNLQTLCHWCNAKKGTQSGSEWDYLHSQDR